MSDSSSTRTFAQVTSFPFGEPFQRGLLALAFREPRFVERFGFTMAPSYFDVDEYRHLSRVILDYANRHFRCPDAGIARELVVAYCISNRFDLSIRDRLVQALDAIVSADLSHADWIREKAVEFAVAQAMRDEVLRASKILTEGRYEDYASVISGMQKALDMGSPNEQVLVFSEVASNLPEYISRESSLTQVRRVPTGLKPLDDDMFGGPGRGHLGVVLGPSKRGKLIADDVPVMTINGWKTHGTLVVGDVVFGPDGSPTRVVAVGPPDFADTLVTFTDGSAVQCHREHEWTLWDRSGNGSWRTVEAEYLIDSRLHNQENGRERPRFQLPLRSALQFPERWLPLAPYAMGAWLGDGTHTKPCITHSPLDMEMVMEIERLGYPISSVQIHKTTGVHTTYFGGVPPSPGNPGTTGAFRVGLRAARVFGDKHIPSSYLTASEEQRLQLLAGLIDSDGCYDSNRRVRISTVLPKLAAGIADLVRSLGWRAGVRILKPKVSGYGGRRDLYEIGFTPDRPIPTKIPRKRIATERLCSQRRVGVDSAIALTHDQWKPGRCIQVDRPDGLYLVGMELIPTHNSHVLTSFGAAAMAAGFGVHHITIQDLDVWDVALRYASNITGIPSQEIQQGTPNYVSTISRFMERFKYDLAITEFAADTLTPAALRSHISTTAARTGVNPDCIIVDYADLMASGQKPTFNSAEKSEQMGWIYLQLLKMFRQFDAVGWTGSQVQREMWDRELIGNSGVARSVQKISHAHYVLTLNQTDVEAEENKMRLFSSGFRRGKDKQTYHCILDKSTSRLTLDPTPRVDPRRNAHEEAANTHMPMAGGQEEDLAALVARMGEM